MKNSQIRVLQIIRHMNVGGAETFIMNVYRNIDKEKVQFDFLVNGKGYFDEEIEKLGGKIFYMDYITEVGHFRYKKQLLNFFKEHPEYNIIHTHIDQVSGIILEMANKSKIQHRIVHSHNTKNSNNLFGKIYKGYLQSKINRNGTIFLACGKEAAQWLYKNQSNRAIIVNNGININKFKYSEKKRNEIRKELNISEDTVLLGHVGRFSKQKNHKFLIKIYQEYFESNPKSKLLLIGKGALEDKIKRMVNKIGLENQIQFLEIRQDVHDIYSALDYFVFPSLYEGLSVSMIEAQVSGLSIFASDTIDYSTDISGNIEWLSIKHDSPRKWSEEILKTSKERKSQSVNAEEYDIKYIAKKMYNLYLNLGDE